MLARRPTQIESCSVSFSYDRDCKSLPENLNKLPRKVTFACSSAALDEQPLSFSDGFVWIHDPPVRVGKNNFVLVSNRKLMLSS